MWCCYVVNCCIYPILLVSDQTICSKQSTFHTWVFECGQKIIALFLKRKFIPESRLLLVVEDTGGTACSMQQALPLSQTRFCRHGQVGWTEICNKFGLVNESWETLGFITNLVWIKSTSSCLTPKGENNVQTKMQSCCTRNNSQLAALSLSMSSLETCLSSDPSHTLFISQIILLQPNFLRQ